MYKVYDYGGLKIKVTVVHHRLRICRQLRSNLLQTSEQPNKTLIPQRRLFVHLRDQVIPWGRTTVQESCYCFC